MLKKIDLLGDPEDQMKMYQRGVEDNTTVVTFSMKVYYTIEVNKYRYLWIE